MFWRELKENWESWEGVLERTKRELGVLTRCLGEPAAGVRLGGVCSERPGIGRPLQQNKPTRETSWKAKKQADNFNNLQPGPTTTWMCQVLNVWSFRSKVGGCMGGTGGSEHLQGSTCQVPRAYLTLSSWSQLQFVAPPNSWRGLSQNMTTFQNRGWVQITTFCPKSQLGPQAGRDFARAPPSAVPGGGASCHLTRLFNPVGGHQHLISTQVEEIGETLHPCLLQHYQVLLLPAFLPSSLDTIFHAVQICKTFR